MSLRYPPARPERFDATDALAVLFAGIGAACLITGDPAGAVFALMIALVAVLGGWRSR